MRPELSESVQARPTACDSGGLRESGGAPVVQIRPSPTTTFRPALHGCTAQLVLKGSNPGFYLVREVAALLRVSRATVYALVARGELGPIWVSNAIRIPREAVVAYLSDRPKNA